VNQRRRRTHILLGCITAIFFVCWGPLVLYSLLYEFVPEIFPERSVIVSVGYTLSLLFGMLTPIANPVLYGLLNDSFKEVACTKLSFMFR
jgi:cytochrome c biogenesis factor